MTEPQEFVRKATTVKAVQWNVQDSPAQFESIGIRLRAVPWWDESEDHWVDDWELWVEKSGVWCKLAVGDWMIEEPDGIGWYPCAKAIFEDSYVAVRR